jgi:hypothetical protein
MSKFVGRYETCGGLPEPLKKDAVGQAVQHAGRALEALVFPLLLNHLR